jgi:hypothetical protein
MVAVTRLEPRRLSPRCSEPGGVTRLPRRITPRHSVPGGVTRVERRRIPPDGGGLGDYAEVLPRAMS